MRSPYCVVYRTGDRENFQWLRTPPVESREDAERQQNALVRTGHHAFVEDYRRSLAIGLPEGWERVGGGK